MPCFSSQDIGTTGQQLLVFNGIIHPGPRVAAVGKPVYKNRYKLSYKLSEYHHYGVNRDIFDIFIRSEIWIKIDILKTVYGIKFQQSEQTNMQNLDWIGQ